MSRRSIALIDPRRIMGLRDDWFGDVWDNTIGAMAVGNYGLNMYETADEVVVELEAPGYKADQVDIEIEDGVLNITGKVETKSEEEDRDKKYFHKEITRQSFSRSVTLPAKVKGDSAEASFEDGMIVVRLPKAAEVKPHKITVKKQ